MSFVVDQPSHERPGACLAIPYMVVAVSDRPGIVPPSQDGYSLPFHQTRPPRIVSCPVPARALCPWPCTDRPTRAPVSDSYCGPCFVGLSHLGHHDCVGSDFGGIREVIGREASEASQGSVGQTKG